MRFIITLLCSLYFVPAFSQTLNGIVYGTNATPLSNASVECIRSKQHTHTNEKGQFTLTGLLKGDSINVSHLGYIPQTIVYTSANATIQLHTLGLHLKDVVVSANVAHLNVISTIDLNTSPVQSSQELLRQVPGLFIGQHAGGGKAEQIFLRGFDIDHGTDINLTVDGMPVNMVSHAHGQGYADLHFLIPETVDKIDFDKGPYHAAKGNMATAGYVEFKTKDRLDYSSIKAEVGKFNTTNLLGTINLLNTSRQSAYIASEYLNTDGFFKASQNFNRINLAGKYTNWLENKDKWSMGFSHFNSRWDASGQIPERAVQNGNIAHFGAIDSTEGGSTQRTNINLEYLKYLNDSSFVKNSAYFSQYQFELYSNFTYFLNDPVNGDQIRQRENRSILGYLSELNQSYQLGTSKAKLQAGLGFRHDYIKNNELSHTVNRFTTLENIQLGDINESNLFAYASTDIHAGKWLINPAIRWDYFRFMYNDKLSTNYSNVAQGKTAFSPKLNFMYTAHHKLQLFLKTGKGFHSNDTRVVLAETAKKILPAAYGTDAGILWKPHPRLLLNSALWFLYLEQEFVYVGDEGIVEPSGKTRRLGLDLGMRYQLNNWLFFNSDLSFAKARSIDAAEGANYIPLAVPFTYTGSLLVKRNSGFNGGLKLRHLANRPATEDRSIIAKGYTITDLNLNYQFRKVALGFMAENIFNTKWKETQFATESRLRTESNSVEEIHYTPGTPFNIRFSLAYRF